MIMLTQLQQFKVYQEQFQRNSGKAGRNSDGKSTYTVVLNDPLTQAEINSFLSAGSNTRYSRDSKCRIS